MIMPIPLNQLKAIVGAPTENTFGSNDPIVGYNDLTWWTQPTH